MTETRRDFLKFVVAGSVAAGCPVIFRCSRPERARSHNSTATISKFATKFATTINFESRRFRSGTTS